MSTIAAAPAAAADTIRALRAEDLDAVVAIDAAIEGRSRRRYIERRLQAALREPAQHVQLAALAGRGIAGYVLARLVQGEFGRSATGLRLEMVGVRDDLRGSGVGRQLLQAAMAWSQRHGATELRTTGSWRRTRMLHWFDRMGFELAPIQIVERAVGGAPLQADDRPVARPEAHGPGHEVDFGMREANDFERQTRGGADVRPMSSADVSDIVRIDRGITGRDRRAYIAQRLAETMDDSAIRVSLTARLDDTIVGYLMARADLGDFGRIDPVAVIDTLGVDPEYARRGVGRALVSQLFANLDALRVERVETVTSLREPELARFFTDLGFAPSQRLAFVRAVG
ncbi:MAG: GNAT family N-acetyltransferase [Ideonella sp.]|nr:GNAT family N-acetyltransferase [Ideonella sp.]MCC7458278.1 GNAT family N-acetyltransferase [Nitrospira sp.]